MVLDILAAAPDRLRVLSHGLSDEAWIRFSAIGEDGSVQPLMPEVAMLSMKARCRAR